MNNTEAIEVLQFNTEFVDAEFEDALILAISALKEGRWIPVTDGLPKSDPDDLEYPTVLVSFPDGEVCTACYYESTKEWGTGEDYNRVCYPTAWRPLPEAYKEEENHEI